jgi:hypothetical protein
VRRTHVSYHTDHSPVTILFLSFDIAAFLIQGAGGAIFAAPNPNVITPARAILVVGFLTQIIAFGAFLAFAVRYQVMARRGGVLPGGWSRLLYTLYATCVCILVRSMYVRFACSSGG